MQEEARAKTTRERVLKTLLTHERRTINELAESVGINPISVRHHINKLEAEGLVTSEEERHGVGRPRRIYYLSEKGREQFPTRYIQLTVRLLEQLKETMPEPMVNKIFSEMARDMASEYTNELEGLSMEERLDLIKELLTNEGFTVEWQQEDDYYQIREINCPYFRVGMNHPEVCALDETLISTLLDIPAQKVKCMLEGDSYCTYLIPKDIKTMAKEIENSMETEEV
jgi:DeoR family transcriptional regulator, suf operon transcriptional repressor